MRTIRELVGKEEKVYILLRNKPIRYRFMADAAMEGITYGDGVPATDREVEDIMALQQENIPAVVFGKAYYEGRIDLATLRNNGMLP